MDSILYRERVLPSPGTYLIPLVIAVMVLALALPAGAWLAVPLSIAVALTSALLMLVKAPVLEVTNTSLRVGRARIERTHLGVAVVIEEQNAFAERGHRLDARAYTCFQSSVRTMVKVNIMDESDPTPYWLFSTRQPELVAQALNA